MNAKEFTKAYQQTHDGASFGNVTDIAKFVGCDRHKIGTLVNGLQKFGRNYFIPDVAERLEGEMK